MLDKLFINGEIYSMKKEGEIRGGEGGDVGDDNNEREK